MVPLSRKRNETAKLTYKGSLISTKVTTAASSAYAGHLTANTSSRAGKMISLPFGL